MAVWQSLAQMPVFPFITVLASINSHSWFFPLNDWADILHQCFCADIFAHASISTLASESVTASSRQIARDKRMRSWEDPESNQHMSGVVYYCVLAPLSVLVIPSAACSRSQMSRSAISHCDLAARRAAPVRSSISQPICSSQTVVRTSKMSLAPATAGRCKPDHFRSEYSRVLSSKTYWRTEKLKE